MIGRNIASRWTEKITFTVMRYKIKTIHKENRPIVESCLGGNIIVLKVYHINILKCYKTSAVFIIQCKGHLVWRKWFLRGPRRNR